MQTKTRIEFPSEQFVRMKVYQSFFFIWTILLTLKVKLAVSYEVDGFEHMYQLGKEAYLNEEWTYCAKFMEAAVKDYREYQVRSD